MRIDANLSIAGLDAHAVRGFLRTWQPPYWLDSDLEQHLGAEFPAVLAELEDAGLVALDPGLAQWELTPL